MEISTRLAEIIARSASNQEHQDEQAQPPTQAQHSTRGQHDWFNLSVNDFDFENKNFFKSDGFKFDEEFERQDAGQLINQLTILEATELLQQLRNKEERNLEIIPQIIFDFYDQILEHCQTEFMNLLRAYISNNDVANRLSENCRTNDLIKFYRFELNGKVNLGPHDICSKAAAELEETFNNDLKEMGLKFQRLTQCARMQTALKLLDELENCSVEFENYGKKQWEDLCRQHSHHNIFDQKFTVKFTHPEQSDKVTPCVDQENVDDDDDEVYYEAFEFANEEALTNIEVSKSSSKSTISMFKLSTYVFGMAIHDCREKVNALIIRHRKKLTDLKLKAAALKAKQANVDIRADSMTPVDIAATIGQQLAQVHTRIDRVQATLAANSTMEVDTSRTKTNTAVHTTQEADEETMETESLRSSSTERFMHCTDPIKVNGSEGDILRLTQQLEVLKKRQRDEHSMIEPASEYSALPQRPKTIAKQAAKVAMKANASKAKTDAATPSRQESDQDTMETEYLTSSSESDKRVVQFTARLPSAYSKNVKGASSMETDQPAPRLRFVQRQRGEVTSQDPSRKEGLLMTMSQTFSKHHRNLSTHQLHHCQPLDFEANGQERRVENKGKRQHVQLNESHQLTMNASSPRFVMTKKTRGGGLDPQRY